MTPFQLDPSAQAPWATTTMMFSENGMSLEGMIITQFFDWLP